MRLAMHRHVVVPTSVLGVRGRPASQPGSSTGDGPQSARSDPGPLTARSTLRHGTAPDRTFGIARHDGRVTGRRQLWSPCCGPGESLPRTLATCLA